MNARRSPPPGVTVDSPLAPAQKAAAEQPFRLADRLALRPRELAACLGVSERTLRQIAPELPRIHRGGLVLYPVDPVREWLRREAKISGDPLGAAAVAALARRTRSPIG